MKIKEFLFNKEFNQISNYVFSNGFNDLLAIDENFCINKLNNWYILFFGKINVHYYY